MSKHIPSHPSKFKNLVDLLQKRALEKTEEPLYIFLQDGEEDSVEVTHGHLDRQARAIGAYLQERKLEKERAVLLYPPGLEYIAGFFGCLYGNVIAVPAYPPDPNRLERTLPRLEAIIKDCQAKVILTTEAIKSMVQFLSAQAPGLAKMDWVATDTLAVENASDWKDPVIKDDTVAFLQYTSGSTGDPKGVILTHSNLIHNLDLVQKGFGMDSSVIGLSWLPPYHDMGLIGGILEPLYISAPTLLMSPLHFLQRPFRWLKAFAKTKRPVVSGGPNFAYEMCIEKTTPEQKEEIDLSHWQVAFTGAEPVQKETLDRFAEAFAPSGFKQQSFYPCYGLAEATLIVSGGVAGTGFKSLEVPKGQFQKNLVVKEEGSDKNSLTLVSCGKSFANQNIKIVRPDTFDPCQEGEVGEIWIQGPSVAQGYWNDPDKTEATFQAHIKGSQEGPFLRSGDLGFLQGGDLYVTGRLKDLIIIRGNNHYPHDIERTMDKTHPSLRPGCAAAFSVQIEFEERLVVAQEVDLTKLEGKPDEIAHIHQSIRNAISANHDLEVFAIALLNKGGLPKTSSGKVRRQACREEFLGGKLDIAHEFRAKTHSKRSVPPAGKVGKDGIDPDALSPIPENVQTWLIQKISEHLDIDSKEFDSQKPLYEYGLDSKDAVNLSGDLEEWLGCALSPTILWKYPTVESLAGYLTSEEMGQNPGTS